MELTENHIELIEKYLSGALDKEAKFAFEKRMKEDDTLRDQVEQLKAIQNASRAQQLNQKFELLKSIEAKNELKISSSQKRSDFKRWKWIGIAASIAGIVIMSILLMPKKTSPVFAEFMTALDINSDRSGDLSNAFDLYNSEDYRKAAPLIEKAVVDGEEKNNLIYAAISYLYSNKYKKAEVILDDLQASGYQPEWHINKYKALALIGMRKVDVARAYLEESFPAGNITPEVAELYEVLVKNNAQ